MKNWFDDSTFNLPQAFRALSYQAFVLQIIGIHVTDVSTELLEFP